mmetsp:Transcript_20058/g.17776  ORF Transcript_20058/g.17776 Transcript_20058/m.17776 type:complete len:124 (-) Transcript_20058:97-468(-)
MRTLGLAEKYHHECFPIMRRECEPDIGISYKCGSNTDTLFVTGFHIDKPAIMEQRSFAMSPKHHPECNCLNEWADNPTITHLTIGDPNQHHMDKEAMNSMINEHRIPGYKYSQCITRQTGDEH